MRDDKLTPRLAAVVDMVPACDTAVDVGCDHAKLAVWLVQSGRVLKVTATDIRKGPLSRASRNVERAGLSGRIELKLCDGLDGVSPKNAVVIAGMGGETIVGILGRADWTRETGCMLVLQPMTAADELRGFLARNGYEILRESFARERDKLYVVLTAAKGDMVIDEPSKLYVSDAARTDPLVSEYIDGIIKMLSKRLKGLECARVTDEKEKNKIRAVIDTLIKRRDCYAKSFGNI